MVNCMSIVSIVTEHSAAVVTDRGKDEKVTGFHVTILIQNPYNI